MAAVKSSNADRAANFIGAQARAAKQSASSNASSEANSLGRDMDAIRIGRAKRFAEMKKRADEQSSKK